MPYQQPFHQPTTNLSELPPEPMGLASTPPGGRPRNFPVRSNMVRGPPPGLGGMSAIRQTRPLPPPPPPTHNLAPKTNHYAQAPRPTGYIEKYTSSPRCPDVVEHISNCPVCKKLYKKDQTVWIIAVITLILVILLLLKKLLNV